MNQFQRYTIEEPLRGIEMAYTDVGSGRVVLLLHGFPFDKSMWKEQIDFLQDTGFRAIAPDLPGLGETVAQTLVCGSPDERHRLKSVPPTTMDEMARCAAALLDELNVEAAAVCGLSMGGYVAFEFAHLFPLRVRALILAGTRAPADNNKEKEVREQQAQRMLAEGMSFVTEATLPKLLAPRTLSEKPDVIARVREMILKADPRGAAAAQRGMALRRDYSADLDKICMPTLIIVGREDPIRPVADAELMHRGIRNSQLAILEDAAHMTNLEQPETFNHALLKFLELIH